MLLTAILMVSVPLIAGAAIRSESLDDLRCGTNLVLIGETKLQVRHQCGLPDSRSAYPYYGRHGVFSEYVEKWTYNRGPEDFVYNFIFRDGRLTDIRRVDRGF